MERRDFLKALIAGSAVATPSIPALAGDLLAAPNKAMPTLLVCQSDFPGAPPLGAAIAAALHRAGGTNVASIARPGQQLCLPAQIDALLAQGRQGRIVGIMDDATAVVFQEIAAARGSGYLLQTQHRFAADGVRHHCRLTGLAEAIAWSAPLDGGEAQLAQLYADILTGQPPGNIGSHWPMATDSTVHTSLVSFVLKA